MRNSTICHYFRCSAVLMAFMCLLSCENAPPSTASTPSIVDQTSPTTTTPAPTFVSPSPDVYSECAIPAVVPAQVLAAMQNMKIVNIGEFHGGISFSPLQTVEVFKSAFCTKKSLTIVLEMIPSTFQSVIDEYLNSKISLDTLDQSVQLSKHWYGGQPYRDILEWSKSHGAKVFGGDYGGDNTASQAEKIMAPVIPNLEKTFNSATPWNPMLSWDQEDWYRDQEMARVTAAAAKANSSGLTLTYTGLFHSSIIPALIDPQILASSMTEVLLGMKDSDPTTVSIDNYPGEPLRIEIGNMNWVGPWQDQPHISWVFAKTWTQQSENLSP